MRHRCQGPVYLCILLPFHCGSTLPSLAPLLSLPQKTSAPAVGASAVSLYEYSSVIGVLGSSKKSAGIMKRSYLFYMFPFEGGDPSNIPRIVQVT